MSGYRARGARLDSRKADRMAANYEPGAYRRGDEHNPRSPWFEEPSEPAPDAISDEEFARLAEGPGSGGSNRG